MEIDKSLITTISENGGTDILSELGEITLDLIVDNDAINQIPIIGTLKSIYKITNSISDHLFVQKILKFLRELETLSDKEKSEMKSKIDNESDNKVGETLLEIINKIDDNNKPKIIAVIFKSYINGEIDFKTFQKFSQIVNKSYLPDLLKLTIFFRGQPITNEYSSSLLSMGLIKISEKKYSGQVSLRSLSERQMFEYKLNDDGKKLMYILYPQFEVIS
ncbi:hypothetical protein EV198_0408 [Roseivirga ehrenbergii]|uniref:Uncharacterized protein n=1 Tax=Roseivirga ehrenbergii (strain DSM 102268 / JCM 13514 / KCTC 12282 / NCIMB 14502 / KMM 6017) TaxID=279360 RepID=A0A150X8T1_ROSEK|nr:hypothetical protein [Roseivirga ehrenbergii]KYG75062.1 hypothetical protein MB14_07660 [Roseivirga ehrenbergii]TCL13579.1 hypothetical protein EV198_0408 [Roseivirga ehrenbergii]